MGGLVPASQIVSGLVPEIKAKMAGVEGDLDTLLAKAGFEEAKFKDFEKGSSYFTSMRPT